MNTATQWLFAYGALAVILVGMAEAGGNASKAANLLGWTIAGGLTLSKWNDFQSALQSLGVNV